jgi:hypothetical protein
MIPGIAPHFMLPQSETTSNPLMFLQKRAVFGVFVDPKFRKPHASELASDFLTF